MSKKLYIEDLINAIIKSNIRTESYQHWNNQSLNRNISQIEYFREHPNLMDAVTYPLMEMQREVRITANRVISMSDNDLATFVTARAGVHAEDATNCIKALNTAGFFRHEWKDWTFPYIRRVLHTVSYFQINEDIFQEVIAALLEIKEEVRLTHESMINMSIAELTDLSMFRAKVPIEHHKSCSEAMINTGIVIRDYVSWNIDKLTKILEGVDYFKQRKELTKELTIALMGMSAEIMFTTERLEKNTNRNTFTEIVILRAKIPGIDTIDCAKAFYDLFFENINYRVYNSWDLEYLKEEGLKSSEYFSKKPDYLDNVIGALQDMKAELSRLTAQGLKNMSQFEFQNLVMERVGIKEDKIKFRSEFKLILPREYENWRIDDLTQKLEQESYFKTNVQVKDKVISILIDIINEVGFTHEMMCKISQQDLILFTMARAKIPKEEAHVCLKFLMNTMILPSNYQSWTRVNIKNDLNQSLYFQFSENLLQAVISSLMAIKAEARLTPNDFIVMDKNKLAEFVTFRTRKQPSYAFDINYLFTNYSNVPLGLFHNVFIEMIDPSNNSIFFVKQLMNGSYEVVVSAEGCDTIPAKFICPISEKIMKDPVSTSDGSVYERKFIEYWFQNKIPISPLTGKSITYILIANTDLKSEIDAFLKANKECKRD